MVNVTVHSPSRMLCMHCEIYYRKVTVHVAMSWRMRGASETVECFQHRSQIEINTRPAYLDLGIDLHSRHPSLSPYTRNTMAAERPRDSYGGGISRLPKVATTTAVTKGPGDSSESPGSATT